MNFDFDWEKISAGVSAAAAGALLFWNRILAARKKVADTNADIAAADGDRAMAQAGETVFTLVTQRLQSVEAELSAVRGELNTMREQLLERDNRIHFLEMHVVDLEHCLRQHGIEPPPPRKGGL